MTFKTHIIKVGTLHGSEAEKLLLYQLSGNAALYFEFDKDEKGEHVAEIYAEFYERVEDRVNAKQGKEHGES